MARSSQSGVWSVLCGGKQHVFQLEERMAGAGKRLGGEDIQRGAQNALFGERLIIAGSSITAPRPTLITTAPGSCGEFAAPIMPRVSGVSGAVTTT
jgi:hypothetical protein